MYILEEQCTQKLVTFSSFNTVTYFEARVSVPG